MAREASEAEKVIEFKSVKAKTLSADKESLQQHVQLLSSQIQDLQEEVRKGGRALANKLSATFSA